VLAWDAVVAPQVALGLVPEVLDPVDVVALVGEQFGMVDPHVVELRDIEHIVAAEGVGIDHAVGPDLLLDDRDKRVGTGICDDRGIDLALPLEQSEHRHLARQQLGRFGFQGSEDHLAQLVVKQDRGVPVDTRNLRRGAAASIFPEVTG